MLRLLGPILLACGAGLLIACDDNPASIGFSMTDTGQLVVLPVRCDYVERVVGVRVTDRDTGSILWEAAGAEGTEPLWRFVVGEVPTGWTVAQQATPVELGSDANVRVELEERWSKDRLVTVRQDVQMERLQPGLVRAESKLLSADDFVRYQRDSSCP